MPLLSQCPDGSPPPCRAGRAAAPSLALNESTWLVLPFENTARASDAELIRQASVPQLYAEMSQWSGVRVVSDDRVADLLQSLPAAQRERVGLEAARGLARRVGAGRVVLGGYLAAGGRANVTAKVYETRTGRELRVVRDPVAGFQTPAALDSLSASFGRLARGILAIPEGVTGESRAVAGTQSLDAYREYVAGMDAFNRVDMDAALAHFDRAIRLDSNFALPRLHRYRLSTDTAAGRQHLEAAIRLSGGLPTRERVMVDAFAATIRNDREAGCAAANRLVSLDSADGEGWAMLTNCHIDQRVVVENGVARYAGNLNRALRSAERAYALAPTSLNAQIAMMNALGAGSFMYCTQRVAICPYEHYYRVSVMPMGDSLAAVVNRWTEVRHAPPDLAPAACAAQKARFERAANVALTIAGRSNSRLFYRLAAQFWLAAGDTAGAAAALGRGVSSFLDTVAASRHVQAQIRLDLELARENVAAYRAWAESLFTLPTAPTQLKSMMGRLSEGLDTNAAQREYAVWRRILTGLYEPGFDSVEQRIAARLTGPQRDDFLQLSTLAGFFMRHAGPALDTTARHPLKQFQAWFAAGNQARARIALGEFDRELTARHVATPDDGGWLFSAESHLLLGDSAVAWQRMQEFGRRWSSSINGAVIMEMRFFHSSTPRLWGRTWLLFADLAAARGQRAEARRAYRMLVGLWEGGEPVVQPFVTRARTALVSLDR